VAGRIMSMKNSNDTIGNQTSDLADCSAVLRPTAPPRNYPMTSALCIVHKNTPDFNAVVSYACELLLF
jgi:hypothetical protein